MRRRGIAVVVGVVALLAAVGGAVASLGGGPIGPTGKAGKMVDAELLEFFQYGGAGLPQMATVLRSRTDAKAVRAWFSTSRESEIERFQEAALERDYGREAVVVFSFGSGCTSADGVRLADYGSGQLGPELTDTNTYETCTAPFDNLAVFAVDKAKAPDDVVLAGARTGRPDPVSPAELVEFGELDDRPRGSARAAEVSQPDQFEDFVKSLPGDAASRLDADASTRGSAYRRFAFVLSGCRAETAFMVIDPERLTAEPDGGGGARCEEPEYYFAVFQIEAKYVPAEAEIG
ncbi:hypothetical protein E1281_08410 [Actinomadura sp. KC345]|uniref:hypothetical protein n=1 Tax=Actinomadura sp. KC345 TaxID=2530371 RepID=UPI001050F3AA|nr:hypothetical protein [Actinomadura sp. KC345]TDC56205.1 hypothetical protein E1281_08410 [Actinomadura sp. KC345]